MKLLTVKQVAEKLSCSRSMVYKIRSKDPSFPKPIHIGHGMRVTAPRWVEEGLDNWITHNKEANENRRSGAEVHQGTREEVPAES